MFLLLIVPGAKIPSLHCQLPWALEGSLWQCQGIFSPPVSGTKRSEKQRCALGSWLLAPGNTQQLSEKAPDSLSSYSGDVGPAPSKSLSLWGLGKGCPC